MEIPINTPLASALIMFLVVPIFSAYGLALQRAEIPFTESSILKMISYSIALTAAAVGLMFLAQIIYNPLHIFDFLIIPIAFLLYIKIVRKGPDFFSKRFFNNKKDTNPK